MVNILHMYMHDTVLHIFNLYDSLLSIQYWTYLNQLAITMIVTNVRSIQKYQRCAIFANCFNGFAFKHFKLIFCETYVNENNACFENQRRIYSIDVFAMVYKHLKHFKLICCETYFSEKIKTLVLETRAEFIPFLESLAPVIYAY